MNPPDKSDPELKAIIGTWLRAVKYRTPDTGVMGFLSDHYHASTYGWSYIPCINDVCGEYRGGQVTFERLPDGRVEITCLWRPKRKLYLTDPKCFEKLARRLKKWHNYLGCNIGRVATLAARKNFK